jgi:hypothetical protein
MIATEGPPGKCQAAHHSDVVGPSAYQRPREKKPSSASTRTTIRMIQRMLMRSLASLLVADLAEMCPQENNGKLRWRVTG